MASLAILTGSAGVTQMPKMPGTKVKVVTTKAVVIVMVIGRSVVGPML